MCQLSSLNQKISSLSENLEKAVNDMKVQDRNVGLLHENIKILQNESSMYKCRYRATFFLHFLDF